ncbi:ribose 5-phosphate isomerase A [Rubrobacter calidifluminis]|uniref:ribose 5-phosphate isomerase A n=1 Tax=Rubrobacter calidifluminis TaxID=1392640 RepID=UPI0023615CB3|nr:ribose 5-phosphate isomerase A [Rubrobacter calidifluminis]
MDGPRSPTPEDDLKRRAGYRAVEEFVRSGMAIGLGTGTTASWAIRRVGELLCEGTLEDVVCVPTSERTAEAARALGIPLATLAEVRPRVTIDGADEISPDLSAIKGRGGALLREKIVAFASESFVLVADETKPVERLGEGVVPVEVEPFGWQATLRALSSLGCEATLRKAEGADDPFVTDGGHYTVDCLFPPIEDPAALEVEIKSVPGALECGLFVGMAEAAVVARSSGGVEILRRGD